MLQDLRLVEDHQEAPVPAPVDRSFEDVNLSRLSGDL
jgi:hypothetical protein